MNEQATLFCVNLSHKWALIVLPLPILFGVVMAGSTRLLARTRASRNRRTRPLGAIIRAVTACLFGASIFLFALSLTHVGCASLVAHRSQCLSNLRELSAGALLYSQDYDERFPPADRWSEAIEPRVREAAKSDEDFRGDPFRCPAAASRASYGMNVFLSVLPLSGSDTPATTVFLFDADAPVRSFAGSAKDIAQQRHMDAPNLAFADGHAKGASVRLLNEIMWTPANASGQQKKVP